MTVLIGHPTGNPFSHHAALAHFELGWLEGLCVPWMPSQVTLRVLESISPLRPLTRRFGRRHFPPLASSPKMQGRGKEIWRFLLRAAGADSEKIVDDANQWLMRTMKRECRRPSVTAIHAYEDCSLLQFVEAKRLGKACIYDLPIGFFLAWEQTQLKLARRYNDWLRSAWKVSDAERHGRKLEEMNLADIVLVPSAFVSETVNNFNDRKRVAIAPYGVDLANWVPKSTQKSDPIIKFLFAGQCSIRKGVPLLIDAWRAAALKNAHLQMVGSWQLAESKKRDLPPNCSWMGPIPAEALRDLYQQADVFVFPTFFEGRALVIGEALASGLPVLTSPASGAADMIDDKCGRLMPVGDEDVLVAYLRWFALNRDKLPEMSRAARLMVERCTWENYRNSVASSIASFIE
jgi:glycosyltransferase involved in cell wall biosynthesis